MAKRLAFLTLEPSGASLNPPEDAFFPNLNDVKLIRRALSNSYFHCLDMTQILLKRSSGSDKEGI